MMGHASIASTQIYAQVTDSKISEDMDRLIAKHQEKNKEDDKVTVKETITIGTMAIANTGRNKSMEETA
jgi:integrase